MSEQHENGIGRRSFMKAAGTVAGASLLGIGTAAGAAGDGFDGTFANWRVREAQKVWDRGYRGRPDRTIGLTDSGIEARHPDLGPWNGVQATTADEELVLTEPGADVGSRERNQVGSQHEAGPVTVGPGSFATGNETVITEFTPQDDSIEDLDATLSWSPNADASNDLEFRIDLQLANGSWEEIARTATASMPEELTEVAVDPGKTYRFVAEQYINTTTQATVTWSYFTYTGDLNTLPEDEVFAFLDEDSDGPMPKTVGWFNETSRYGTYDAPRDPDGHGSHCASIMGGSGRASAVEYVERKEPRAVLTAGDTREYQVKADAGTGVFIAAYGTGIELVIEGPQGRQLGGRSFDTEASTHDVAVAEAPAERDGTYTLTVRAAQGELASTARCQRVAYGRFHEPDATDGDRAAGAPALHSGMAPNASLVGLQGLGDPTISLGEYAADFSRIFNMRAVNMSWGYVGGVPLGAFGGQLDDTPAAIKDIAEGGILTVAAAGNAATPANGNGAPGVADEAISVAATDHSDGLVAYSSGGIGGQDEDGEGEYMKPDVTAPGGSLTDLANAALAGDPDTPEGDQPAIRDYTGKAGTSMASPYTTGTVGLVSEAMEFDAPAKIALPAPEETGFEDVLRLKQVVLATASETAFTAAPFHRAHAPTYQNGGRDPYEGYGRINPDAAVDAVTRTLVDGTGVAADDTASFGELASVGLNLPEDSRAVAGHVVAPDGTIDASVEFSHYSGGNKGMTKGAPHLDLFVYDAEQPAANGEPNIVASAQAVQGSGSVSLDVSSDDSDVYYVVAKIVNVPGVVNGYDVQANFDLAVDYTAAQLPTLSVSGSRSDDGAVFTAGQTNHVTLTVDGISSQLDDTDEVRITDQLPTDWTLAGFGDVETRNGTELDFGTVTAGEVRDGGVTKEYFAEAPSSTGRYEFGAASVELVDGAVEGLRGDEATFGGTDTNTVVGADQNTASDATDI
ncbi:S8 family serine peptidase [Halorarius litoreus]|uniref:S8 family serine peptidase n=1 Tax=Halorarius litoreus TaxID=2962676 RepID=UPI0020CF10C2|nr:S8 family serine peptidase [Halorarius litoreus]